MGRHASSRFELNTAKNINLFGAYVDDLFKGDVKVAAVVLGGKQLNLQHDMETPHQAFRSSVWRSCTAESH
jgi:hypothetical protein